VGTGYQILRGWLRGRARLQLRDRDNLQLEGWTHPNERVSVACWWNILQLTRHRGLNSRREHYPSGELQLMINIKPVEKNNYNGGIHLNYKFKNGYGASVIKHDGSYGNKEGLWELAVTDESGDITYRTPITQDVIGYLTEEKVEKILEDIQEL